MNIKKTLTAIILLLAFSGAALFTLNCYKDDETRVTINLVRNDLAAMGIQPEPELSIIDRVLNFFSTPAEAYLPSWPDDRTDLTLTVLNGNIVVMTAPIPANATSYSTYMPSGYTATIIITGNGDYDGGEPMGEMIHKCWGGQTTAELKSGDDLSITIKMIPMTYITSVYGGSTQIEIMWFTDSLPTMSEFRIYRSTEIDGDYSLVGTVPSGGNMYADNVTQGIRYYYRVSCVNANGEGVMCDPESGIAVIIP